MKALLNTLRIIRSPKVGPKTFYKLLSHHKTLDAIIDAWSSLQGVGPLVSAAVAEKEIAAHHKMGASLLTFEDPLYPSLLRGLADAPPVLSVRGHKNLLLKNNLALVGARNASVSGCQLAENLAEQLEKAGWGIVSGFAQGIDIAAHRGALKKGSIAVFGCGVDVIYPKDHLKFVDRFLETGLMLSEFALGTDPFQSHFPRRNRLIAALALGTVVIEAAFQSGSLITANVATELGRDVFAVPGSPMDPRCRGSNKLIKESAILTETVWDILNAYPSAAVQDLKSLEAQGQMQSGVSGYVQEFYDDAQLKTKILTALSSAAISVDLLIESVGLSVEKVLEILTDLELEEKIERLTGNQIRLKMI